MWPQQSKFNVLYVPKANWVHQVECILSVLKDGDAVRYSGLWLMRHKYMEPNIEAYVSNLALIDRFCYFKSLIMI